MWRRSLAATPALVAGGVARRVRPLARRGIDPRLAVRANVVGRGDPWHAIVSQVIFHVGSLGYGLLFGGAVMVVLRHESIRSTFAMPRRGFQPIIGGEHVS
jgi:hypothetical protein